MDINNLHVNIDNNNKSTSIKHYQYQYQTNKWACQKNKSIPLYALANHHLPSEMAMTYHKLGLYPSLSVGCNCVSYVCNTYPCQFPYCIYQHLISSRIYIIQLYPTYITYNVYTLFNKSLKYFDGFSQVSHQLLHRMSPLLGLR